VPKHSVRWNWIADLPIGRNKWIGGKMNGGLDRILGGWQIAGSGSVTSNTYRIPNYYFGATNKVHVYGTKYPIQDCTSGVCYNGYLYWNGYISPSVLTRKTRPEIALAYAACRPITHLQFHHSYPGARPRRRPTCPRETDISAYWDSNTAWVPLKDGSVAETDYQPGLNPMQNVSVLGPFSWNLNASVFKVVPIREKMFLRFNADFFNVSIIPEFPNRGITA